MPLGKRSSGKAGAHGCDVAKQALPRVFGLNCIKYVICAMASMAYIRL
jgi:hypothetical protein